MDSRQRLLPSGAGLLRRLLRAYLGRPDGGWRPATSTLPISTWTQRDRVLAGLTKSNNAVEGFHNGFKALVGHRNPTIRTWLEAVKHQQNLTEQQLIQQALQQPAPRRKKRYTDMECHFRAVMDQFRHVTVYRYLDLCNVAY